MRIAVCLSGQPREIERCAPSLTRVFLRDHDADCFVHLWSGSASQRAFTGFLQYRRAFSHGRSDTRSPAGWRAAWRAWRAYRAPAARKDFVFPTDAAEIRRLAERAYAPRALEVEPQRHFDIADFDRPEQNRCFLSGETQPGNALSMFYGIREASRLKADWERERGFVYDCVVRCRSDLRFAGPLDPTLLRALPPDGVVLPDHGHYRGVNDQLALGSSAAMDAYAQAYDFVRPYYRAGGFFNPEAILRAHLEERKLAIAQAPLPYELVRGAAA